MPECKRMFYSYLNSWVHGNGLQLLNLVKTWYSMDALHASIFECIFSGSNIFVCILLWKYSLSFRGILQTLSDIAHIPGYLRKSCSSLPMIHFRLHS